MRIDKPPNAMRRMFKALLTGLLAGVVVLCAFLIPPFISKEYDKSLEMIRQENLSPACGEAFADYHSSTVALTILLNGMPHEGMAVSPDGHNWYSPQNGSLSLSLAPTEYEFSATYENRVAHATIEIQEGKTNEIVLDVGNAPIAPEFLMLELPHGESKVFPLEISGAMDIFIEEKPNGIHIVRVADGFALTVDGSLTQYGFFSFALHAVNDNGEATTYLGLRIPRETEAIPIRTVGDLDIIRDNLSGYFVLQNDLDMSGVDNWQPIGSEDYPFTGVFDGGGHEISGFHAPDSLDEGSDFAFFYSMRNAECRNVIFREPRIMPSDVETDSLKCAVIALRVDQGLMENCAVIGGVVAPAKGSASGVVGSCSGIIRGCFNSARVISTSPNLSMSLHNVGGISGAFSGYGYYLANEGEVAGNHITGGISGLNTNNSVLRRCVNSGFIWGNTLVGEFPPGGIVHPGFAGGADVAYCYFVIGQSAVGGKGRMANSLFPISWVQLLVPADMPYLGSFGGEQPDWAYASLDAYGPVPYGIFKKQAELPVMPDVGNHVLLPSIDGLYYYYTLDGNDPRIYCEKSVETLDLTLKQGQVLTVYSARQGCRDSETVIYNPQEVR